MPALYTNGFTMTLTGSIGAGDTTITLPSDPGAALPTPGTGDWMWLTLSDVAQTKSEIIKVPTRSGAVLSGITRGDQGTTGQAWGSGDKIELRWTRDGIGEKAEKAASSIYLAANFI